MFRIKYFKSQLFSEATAIGFLIHMTQAILSSVRIQGTMDLAEWICQGQQVFARIIMQLLG